MIPPIEIAGNHRFGCRAPAPGAGPSALRQFRDCNIVNGSTTYRPDVSYRKPYPGGMWLNARNNTFGAYSLDQVYVQVVAFDFPPPGSVDYNRAINQIAAFKARGDKNIHIDFLSNPVKSKIGRKYSTIEEWSKTEPYKNGKPYFNSDTHRSWAYLAEVRSGGRIRMADWMKIDPAGGFAGGGPRMLPGGDEGPLLQIGRAHDTDHLLGLIGVGRLSVLKARWSESGIGGYGLWKGSDLLSTYLSPANHTGIGWHFSP